MIKLNNWANICKFHNSILFRNKYTKHFWKSEIIFKNHFWKSESSVLFLHLLLKELHGIGLGLLGNLDIGHHGLIVGVAGPFHHYLRRDAA